VLTSAYRSRIEPVLTGSGVPSGVAHNVSSSIEATQGFVAQSAAQHPQATQLLGPANNAFVHALHVSTLCASGVAVVAALLVLAWLPRRGAGSGSGATHGAPQTAQSVSA